MKKTLLLASVASVLSFNAYAGYWTDMYNDMKPYIGADYVYDNIKFGGPAAGVKESYHSGAVNLGARMYGYWGLEALYQQSGKRHKHFDGYSKSEHLFLCFFCHLDLLSYKLHIIIPCPLFIVTKRPFVIYSYPH